ncbi:F-box only protein 3-like [Centruroides vittatus]|uniref:F-box only protein 3-like n=1 Tax=Centruroides vittatus TaxID=120091 RepID=UPI00350F2A29
MLNDLPFEILLDIFTYLDYKDLICCGQLNRRLREASNHDSPWRLQCKKYWLQTECPPSRSWKEHFWHWYKDMGRYIHCYATIKSAWDKITDFMNECCPVIYNSIKDGVSEEELNDAEEKLKVKFPDDLRCSYRIHNGQKLTSPGLMGSMSLYNRYRSESFLDLYTAVAGFQNRDCLRGCMPLTFCLHSALTQFIALSDVDGYEPNTIFYLSLDQNALQYRATDVFISGRTFSEWLTTYARQLCNNEFVVMHDQPFRFYKDLSCKLKTDYITVSVATSFLPESSSINPPYFFHAYRITMSMDEDAPKSESCQLETRHWIITDENGEEKRVDGPGVVGEYPVMFPGASFSWISCTSFNTTYGNMRGHFKMRNLVTGERSIVECPVFHMKCLPYITVNDFHTKKTS